jgi:hypothetical protein
VAPEAQVEWEARAGRLAAAAAFGAAVLPLVGQILSTPTRQRDEGRETADYLIGLDDESTRVMAGTVIQAIGFLLLPVVFWYLYRCLKPRHAGFPRAALIAGIAGPVVFAVVTVLTQLDRIDVAQDFVSSGPIEGVGDEALEERADDATDDQSSTLTWFGLAGSLTTAIAFVITSLNAMRVGLMSRFMGTIGIIIGVLYVFFFLGGPQVIQLFWLAALGFLFLGRWPGGRGPAWESGEAVPWPSAAEQRLAAERARLEEEDVTGSDGHGDLERATTDPDTPREADVPRDVDTPRGVDTPREEGHPRSKKRKRKRRR